jgi:hypothetical protein
VALAGVDTTSNRNEYHGYLLEGKGGRCKGLRTLSLSLANFVEIVGASTSWNSQGQSRAVMGLFQFALKKVDGSWSQCPRGLRFRSAAARLLGLLVRIPSECVDVCREGCVSSGRGLCEELITHLEESYRL